MCRVQGDFLLNLEPRGNPPRRHIFRHILTAIMGVGTGLATRHGYPQQQRLSADEILCFSRTCPEDRLIEIVVSLLSSLLLSPTLQLVLCTNIISSFVAARLLPARVLGLMEPWV